MEGWGDAEDDDGLVLPTEDEVQDDSLWQSERESLKGQLNSTYQKLLTLNKLLKHMTQLVKELSGGDPVVRQNLRKDRLQAQSLCSEVELELNQLSRDKKKLGEKTAKKLRKLQDVFQNLSDRIIEVEKMAKDMGASSLLGSMILDDYNGERCTNEEQMQVQMGQSKPGWEEERDQDLNKLEKDMNEVLQLYVQMNDLIQQQQEYFDDVENKYLEMEAESKSAVSELAKASKYSAYSLPLVGAVVGGLVLGPVGAVAGAKGALALGTCVVGGMGLGAWAGTKIADKKKDDADLVLTGD